MKIYEGDRLFVVIGSVEKQRFDEELGFTPESASMRVHLVMAKDHEVAEDNFRHHYESFLTNWHTVRYVVKSLEVMTTIGNPD